MDPYATHVPTLRALIEANGDGGIKRVLEYGGGLNSTPLFWDAGLTVTTVEWDEDWAQTLREARAHDVQSDWPDWTLVLPADPGSVGDAR